MNTTRPEGKLELTKRQVFKLMFCGFGCGFSINTLFHDTDNAETTIMHWLLIFVWVSIAIDILKKTKNSNQNIEPTVKTPVE